MISALPKFTGPAKTAFRKKAAPPTFMLLKLATALAFLNSAPSASNDLVISALTKFTGPAKTAFWKKAAPPTFMLLKLAPSLAFLNSAPSA